ncbi:HNH endonuclease [Streptosporangium sp. NPDC000239]|uniref:HNH endonuclease n=1 Tax=Streptosporangium sp. NPDC000239 TaxID=3154248 RepID=UPI003323C457
MAKPTILSRPPKPWPTWCNRCGTSLSEPLGLCGGCAKVLHVDLAKRKRELKTARERHRRRMREHAEAERREREAADKARQERLIQQKKERTAKRNRAVFPRASEVTITRADGTIEVRPAYTSPAALRRVAPERLDIPSEMRAKILARDGHACRYCGNDVGPFQIDHVIPVAKGGATGMSNLVTACVPCNQKKGAQVWKPAPRP